jgi:predicted membrane-bound dolichyl-phosphate-mannose-protein mannosyltransferase
MELVSLIYVNSVYVLNIVLIIRTSLKLPICISRELKELTSALKSHTEQKGYTHFRSSILDWLISKSV